MTLEGLLEGLSSAVWPICSIRGLSTATAGTSPEEKKNGKGEGRSWSVPFILIL